MCVHINWFYASKNKEILLLLQKFSRDSFRFMTIEEFENIIGYLRHIIRGTEFEGRVYAVGGCIRDRALGRKEVKDVDLAVELPNGGLRLAQWLNSRRRTVFKPVIFERYGTAMLRLKAFPDDEIEIVQTRRGKYSGEPGSDPAEMFGNIDLDCRLRDLGINSLYLNVSTGEMLDPSGCALDDIKARRLRTPDEPLRVFRDDPVRILRVIRFACTLGWRIPREMLKAMREIAPQLVEIKVERIRAELEKIIQGPDPVRGVELMESTGALEYVLPELARTTKFKVNGAPLFDHLKEALREASARDPRFTVRMAALLHDIGKLETMVRDGAGAEKFPEHDTRGAATVAAMLRRLHIESQIYKEVSFLVAHHHFPAREELPNENRAMRRLRKLQAESRSPERLERVLKLLEADLAAAGAQASTAEHIEWIRSKSEQMHKDGISGYADGAGAQRDKKSGSDNAEKESGKRRRHRGGRKHHRGGQNHRRQNRRRKTQNTAQQ